MKIIITAILIQSSILMFSQTGNYEKLEIQKTEPNTVIEGYFIKEKYKYFNYVINIGLSDNGRKLFITDQKDSILFRYKGQEDSYIMDPSFYKPLNINDPKIILIESGSEYTWGNHIILINKDEIRVIGHLNYGVINMYDPVSFVDDLIIQSKNNVIYFTIDAKEIIYDPGGAKERTILNQKVVHTYENGVFQ